MKLREEVQEFVSGTIKEYLQKSNVLDNSNESLIAWDCSLLSMKATIKTSEARLTEKDTHIRELEAELKRRTELLKGLHISSTKYLFIAKLYKDLSDEEAEQLFIEYCEQNNIPLDE